MFLHTFSLLFLLLCSNALSIQINLTTGRIKGKQLTASISPLGNHTAHVFFGIPYARPPIGALRFSKPRPPSPWKGVLETEEYKPACMSDAVRTYKKPRGGPISEDCLYLNVFTNDFCFENKNCPVIIIIHGGGYTAESASAFDPQILINNFAARNIVVVSVSYRLGVFGFANLDGDRSFMHNNLALYDLLLAVKWVRREIGQFGGSKDRITLSGHSAGGGMVFYFSSSPLTKGLIHQQILMSPPTFPVPKTANTKGTRYVAERVGCLSKSIGELTQEDINEVYDCLRKQPAQKILDAQLYMSINSTYFILGPYVDGEFVTDNTDTLLEQNQVFPVNTMLGTTSAEFRSTRYVTAAPTPSQQKFLLTNLCEHIGYELYTQPQEFTDECYKFYKDNNTVDSLDDDMAFYSEVVKIANAHNTERTKVFLYNYEYTGAGLAFNPLSAAPNGSISPAHSEDVIYVVGTHRNVFAPKDYIIEKLYSGLFANFVNYGDPSPSKEQVWNQYTTENREYFIVDFDENFQMPGMNLHYYPRAVQFWNRNRFKKHSKLLYAPSLDRFAISKLASPIISHLKGESFEKSFEQTEKLFYERERFLEELKLRVSSSKGGVQKKEHSLEIKPIDSVNQPAKGIPGLAVYLSGLALLVALVIVVYKGFAHFLISFGSRNGYEPLEGI